MAKWKIPVIAGFFAVALMLLAGCGSKEVVSNSANQNNPTADQKKTSLEISYVLGHTVHRFVTTAGQGDILAEQFRDQQLMKQGKIDATKYSALVKQATELVSELRLHPSGNSNCRTPFTLKVRSDHDVQSVDGCRSSDAGAALGKLIKNAEFLLYSQD